MAGTNTATHTSWNREQRPGKTGELEPLAGAFHEFRKWTEAVRGKAEGKEPRRGRGKDRVGLWFGCDKQIGLLFGW